MPTAISSNNNITGKRIFDQITVPTTQSRGDFYRERDVNGDLVQEWFWQGQYWLSTAFYYFSTSDPNVGTTTINYYFSPPNNVSSNIYLIEYVANYRFTGTSDATNKISLAFRRNSYTNSNTLIATVDSTANGDLPNTNYQKVAALNLHHDLTALDVCQYLFTRTSAGTIGTVTVSQHVRYRLARK